MDQSPRFTFGQAVGILLALTGVIFLLAGFLHPQGHGDDFDTAIGSMLNNSHWPLAHWLAMISTLLLAWTVWLLTDSGLVEESFVGRAGARLTILGGVFMAVEFAVELAAHGEAAAVVAGQAAPLTELTRSMQPVGWPAWAIGFGLLIIGTNGLVPRIITVLGVIGAVAFGLGGILTMGFELPQAGILFPFGGLLGLWIVWAGVQLARGRCTTVSARQAMTGPSRSEPILGGRSQT